MTEQQVWVLVHLEPDGATVLGVYSSREKAQKAIDVLENEVSYYYAFDIVPRSLDTPARGLV